MRRINRVANAELEPGDYRPLVARAARPPDAVAAHADRRGWRCRPTCTRGSPRSPRRGSRRSSGAGTTSSATSTTWSARRRSREYVDPDHPDETPGRATPPSTRSRRCCSRAPGCAAARASCRPSCDEAYRALERSYLRPTYRWRERTVRRLQDSGLGRGRWGLPAGARAQLARRRSGRSGTSRSRRRPCRRCRRRPAPGGATAIAACLPATLVTSSEVTSAQSTRSISGSWTGAVASAIGGAGQLARLDQRVDLVLAEHAGQHRVAHPRVLEVVAAQVGDDRPPSGPGSAPGR